MVIRILTGFWVALLAGSVSAFEFSVTSTNSYLDNVGNADNFATIFELATLPSTSGGPATGGDLLRLEVLGDFSLNGTETGPDASLSSGLMGVFSSSDVLLDVDAFNPRLRVVDAIDAGVDFVTDSDIPQDFLIDQIVVRIPTGATHLFLAPLDGFVGDNADDNSDFGARLEVVPEPAGAALLAVAMGIIAASGQRGRSA